MTGLPAESEVGKLLVMLETELENLERTLGDNLSGSNFPKYPPLFIISSPSLFFFVADTSSHT